MKNKPTATTLQAMLNHPDPLQLALAIGTVILLILVIWLLLRARRAKKPSSATTQPPRPGDSPTLARNWITSILTALRYLTTRQAWRYEHQWVLLLGEQGSGKSSLASALQEGDREASLLDASSALHHSKHHRGATSLAEGVILNKAGVIIDPPGALPVADAGTDKGRQWQHMLDAINNGRPERPIDAIVLTLSARSLMDKNPEELHELAENNYRQLWQIQKRFEFVLPLYIIVTQCDAVPGYSAFWSQLPASRRNEIWGWSNNSLNDQETVAAIMEGLFDEATDTLRQQQIETASGQEDIPDSDSFFLFPQRFGQLSAPLQTVLDILLKPSTYMVDNYLRGIYFTGSLACVQKPEKGTTNQVDFVQHLFNQKIFKERLLARPVRQSIWSRNRLIRNLQYGMVGLTLTACTLLGYNTLQLRQQVSTMRDTLQTVNSVSRLQATSNRCINQSDVFNVLESIGHVRASFRTLVIPVSFVDSRVLEESSTWLSQRALHDVVMQGMHCELLLRADKLKQEVPPDNSLLLTTKAITNDHKQLINYLQRTRELEMAIDAFNDIAQPGSSGDIERQVLEFESLLHYLYGRTVPSVLKAQGSIYRNAITKVSYEQPIALGPQYKQAVSEIIVRLVTHYHDDLLKRISFGNEVIDNLTRQKGSIPDQVATLQDWLGWVRSSWLGSNPDNTPCTMAANRFEEGLKPLYQKHGYSSNLQQAAQQFSPEQCYNKAMAELGTIRLAPYGTVFVPEDNGYTLNKDLLPELAGIAALQKLPLMHTTARTRFTCQMAATGWKTEQLAEAKRFIGQYQTFTLALKPAPDNALPLYLLLARRQLEVILGDVLTDAQQLPGPISNQIEDTENQVAAASANFTQSVDTLSQLRSQMQQIGYANGASQLDNCVQTYTGNMLRKLDTLADLSHLYAPESGSSPGSQGLAVVYQLGSDADVKDYLSRQRDRTVVLANYAQPFITYLSRNPGALSTSGLPTGATPAYWQGTLDDIKQFRNAVPNGAIANLDDYMSKTLAPMNYDNCSQLLAQANKPVDGNSLFTQRRRQLAMQTQWRCEDRRDADAYSLYRTLATRFNRELAGRYPFAGLSAQDADPATVRAFFQDYLGQKDSINHAISGLKQAHWTPIRAFLSQLDNVAAFLAPTLATKDGSKPFRLDIGFNALPKAAKGADQLINWRLASGSNQLAYPGTTRQLDWPVGEAMLLDMDWASQSVWRPRPDSNQADLQTDKATASFINLGNWGLLRLIASHRPATQPAIDPLDPSRHFLEFTIPLIDSSTPPRNSTARVYLAISLGAVDPKTQVSQPLPLPASWPATAPVYW